MIRPLRPGDVASVQALAHAAHPTWAPHAAEWYTTEHRTLVAEAHGEVVGYTVFGVVNVCQGYGLDCVVRADYRGKGIGHLLHRARLNVCRALGCTHFVGITWAGNAAMVRVLEAAGGCACLTIPGHFPENEPPTDGISYVVRLEG